MKDFWITLSFFTAAGLFVASLVRYIFWLVYFSYTTKFLAIWGLFVIIGFVAACVAQKYKIITKIKEIFNG